MKNNIGLLVHNRLISRSLSAWINDHNNFVVTIEASNQNSLLNELSTHPEKMPQIILLFLNSPAIDAFEAIPLITKQHPQIKFVTITPHLLESRAIIKAVKAGMMGFLLSDCSPDDLFACFHALLERRFYYPDLIVDILKNWHTNPPPLIKQLYEDLDSNKQRFISLVCTDVTYEGIAATMGLSPKTIDGYRDFFFDKLGVNSRVGLVIEILKHKWVSLEQPTSCDF